MQSGGKYLEFRKGIEEALSKIEDIRSRKLITL